jgi:hypothetical protein
MSRDETTPVDHRTFTFEPTPAVAASRSRSRYVPCPVCQVDNSQYLFHRVGVRFVRCRTCELVYVSPAGEAGPSYFDVARTGQYATEPDLDLADRDFQALLTRLSELYERTTGEPLRRTLLAGRWLDRFESSELARTVGLSIARIDDATFAALATQSDVSFVEPFRADAPQVVILNELLEGTSDPAEVMKRLGESLPASTWFVVTFSNGLSLPAALLRRYWSRFFDRKVTFFNTSNLAALMARQGLFLTSQFALPTHHTADYVLRRVAPRSKVASVVRQMPAGKLSAPVRTGNHVAIFARRARAETTEKLSIVFPVFNEARYVAQVIEAVLAKQLRIPKELIIVESNSTDGTREIVQKFASHPEVKLILEDRPQGKGHAVRSGLAAVSGSIVLIQDADFEYDIEDYDALLEPILQRRTSFVLGSRTLGLDSWKVRRFEGTAVKRALLNLGQYVFAATFNALYQKRITDVNTMFKVFRSECLQGLDLESDGFDLDIELACKLVMNGNAPLEVPVNYVARGFEEGKKISFTRDAVPSYAALWRYRFGGSRHKKA